MVDLRQDSNIAREAVTAGWLIAILLDRLAFPHFLESPIGVLSLLLAIIAICRPDPRWAVAALLANGAVLATQMPDLGNHMVLQIVVVALLLSWYVAPSFQPLMAFRVMTIALYAIAVFHKLNDSFIDPVVSCGAFIANTTLADFGLPEGGSWLGWISIAVTFASEGGLAILLVFRRTRAVGLLFGILFHAGLAVVPIGGVPSFSVFMFASYMAFASTSTLRAIAEQRTAYFVKPAEWMGMWFWPATVIVTAVVTAAGVLTPGGPILLARIGGVVIGLVTFGFFFRAYRTSRPAKLRASGRSDILVAVALSLFLVGSALLPYAGGRTQASFSMFSNLRTEIAPNHLFFSAPHLFGYQDDLIDIDDETSTLLAEYGAGDLLLPGYEMGRQLASDSLGPGLVVFTDDTGRHELDLEAARIRFPAPNAVESFLFRLREIEPDGPVACRH